MYYEILLFIRAFDSWYYLFVQEAHDFDCKREVNEKRALLTSMPDWSHYLWCVNVQPWSIKKETKEIKQKVEGMIKGRNEIKDENWSIISRIL